MKTVYQKISTEPNPLQSPSLYGRWTEFYREYLIRAGVVTIGMEKEEKKVFISRPNNSELSQITLAESTVPGLFSVMPKVSGYNTGAFLTESSGSVRAISIGQKGTVESVYNDYSFYFNIIGRVQCMQVNSATSPFVVLGAIAGIQGFQSPEILRQISNASFSLIKFNNSDPFDSLAKRISQSPSPFAGIVVAMINLT